MAYREPQIGLLIRMEPDEAAAQLRSALAAAGWDIRTAAVALDISVPTLYRLAARLVHRGHELIGEARQQREQQRECRRIYATWVSESQAA